MCLKRDSIQYKDIGILLYLFCSYKTNSTYYPATKQYKYVGKSLVFGKSVIFPYFPATKSAKSWG